MKVLLTAIRHYSDAPTGSSRIAYDEAKEFARLGHETWMIAPTVGSDFQEYSFENGCHLLRYERATLSRLDPRRRSAHQVAVARLLRKYLPTIDLVHGHSQLQYQAAINFYPASVRKCYTIHSPVKFEMELVYANEGFWSRLTSSTAVALLRRIEHECLQKSDAVTALSQFTADSIRQLHGNDIADKIQIIPGWVDTQRFQPDPGDSEARQKLGWKPDIPVFFTLRRLTPRMGIDRLVDASELLRKRGLKFSVVIAGQGPLRESLQRQVSRQSLSDVVTFAGLATDDEVTAMYRACNAFVLPTRALEGFGLIAIEALASGKPVLATPMGAIPEVMSRFEPQWLAESADSEAIAGLLEKFLTGQLPQHAPGYLHERAKRLYDKPVVLGQLIAAVTGESVASATYAQCGTPS